MNRFDHKQHIYRITFLFLMLAACLIYWPQRDFWPLVVQGDLARDLYVYHRTLLGELPYRDYFYNYGPLMPFYYAFFYMLLGVKFASVIAGVIVLEVLSGVALYLILVRWTTPLVALLGACWFWIYYDKVVQNFNHIGAVPLILFNAYFLIRFSDGPRIGSFLGIMATVLMLLLVKINVGLAVLGASSVVVAMMWNRGKLKGFPVRWPLLMLGVFPGSLAAFIYAFLLQGQPLYYIKQCLPLSSAYFQFQRKFFFQTLGEVVSSHFNGLESASRVWPDRFLIVSFLCFSLFLLLKRGSLKSIKNPSLILLVALLFLSHEFILLGVHYQLWLLYPVFICLFFLMAWTSLKDKPFIRKVWLLVTAFVMAGSLYGGYAFKSMMIGSDRYLLPFDRMKIYSFNPPGWIHVVAQTSNYLESHLLPKETFFAVPYEPIYYWLLDRQSPVRETTFFDFVNIPPDQERRIIADLERMHVNYIVMSNRVHSPEEGLGTFGVSNCRLLAEYIEKQFSPVTTFGDWDNNAKWSVDHAIRIYRRKSI